MSGSRGRNHEYVEVGVVRWCTTLDDGTSLNDVTDLNFVGI